MRPPAFRKALLNWYDANKRDLPWRRESDPYRIWVSEIMLQQTQVSTVIPYYEKFLKRFPTVSALARAEEPDVLAAWAGLGYYRRARFLHEGARLVVERHGGRFPDDPELKLPGIGRYTKGAILSIAFGRPLPVLDGNVARVLSRLFAIRGEPKTNEKRLWALAEAYLDRERPGDFNQAMMELGATVCVPAGPACGRCPLSGACEAKRLGLQDKLPTPAKRPDGVAVRLECVLCRRGGKLLLEQRSTGLLRGHWGLPEAGPSFGPGTALGSVRHQITRHSVTLSVRTGELRGAEKPTFRWAKPSELEGLLVSSLWKKALKLQP